MDDAVGGALLTEILDSDGPCSLEELCGVTGVKKFTKDQIKQSLTNLCSIGIVSEIQGDLYIAAEKKDKYSGSAGQRQVQSLPDRIDALYPRDQAPVPAGGSLRCPASVVPPNPTHRSVPMGHHSTVSAVIDSQALVKKDERNQVVTSEHTYDCEDQVQELTEKLQKIMTVIQPGDSPIHASKIAQMSGLGQSRSVVNRELYLLKKRGILDCDSDAKWSLVKSARDDELRVCAADLAKKPSGKKASSSSSGHVAKTGQSSSQGAAPTDCQCPNRGESCNHFHVHQINHYHQTNVQVGDNNQLYFAGNGEVRKEQ